MQLNYPLQMNKNESSECSNSATRIKKGKINILKILAILNN